MLAVRVVLLDFRPFAATLGRGRGIAVVALIDDHPEVDSRLTHREVGTGPGRVGDAHRIGREGRGSLRSCRPLDRMRPDRRGHDGIRDTRREEMVILVGASAEEPTV